MSMVPWAGPPEPHQVPWIIYIYIYNIYVHTVYIHSYMYIFICTYCTYAALDTRLYNLQLAADIH
jgi:hypothetical protein